MKNLCLKNLYLTRWLGDYLRWHLSRSFRREATGTTHILFLFVDHFELDGKPPRLAEWMVKYPLLASKHVDGDGIPPRHTWFYALDHMRETELEHLRKLVDAGLGELELHWHHSHPSANSFQDELCGGLRIFQKHGFMLPNGDGKAACFGFIHGNWSLNNSRGIRFCGVENEIEILKRAGCYGDFTFPALHTAAQPRTVNRIYYADTSVRGFAGYATGRESQVGKGAEKNEFMIFEGPLIINWRDWRFKWHPMIENGEIGDSNSHGDPKRIDAWVRTGIHVPGRPEWVFVKVFCHGAQDYRFVLGAETERMFSYLEKKYNDGVNYKLHYVTAREAYNIVRAAEDGKSGDPAQYRDYVIPSSGRNDMIPDAGHELQLREAARKKH